MRAQGAPWHRQPGPTAAVCPGHRCAAMLQAALAPRDTLCHPGWVVELRCSPRQRAQTSHTLPRAVEPLRGSPIHCPHRSEHAGLGCKAHPAAPPSSGTADPISPASDPICTSILPLWTGFHTSALLHTYLQGDCGLAGWRRSPVPQESAGGHCLPRHDTGSSCQHPSIPCALADRFPKSPGEGFLQGGTAGFPFTRAACPVPSGSVLRVCLLIWVPVNCPSKSRADSHTYGHPRSFSSPMGAALAPRSFWGSLSLPWGLWPAALPGCASVAGPSSRAP